MANLDEKLNALVRAATDASLALSKIAAADGVPPGHVAYLTKAEISRIAEQAQNGLDDAIIASRQVSA